MIYSEGVAFGDSIGHQIVPHRHRMQESVEMGSEHVAGSLKKPAIKFSTHEKFQYNHGDHMGHEAPLNKE